MISELQPPGNNGHYVWVPTVVVVHGLDYIFETLISQLQEAKMGVSLDWDQLPPKWRHRLPEGRPRMGEADQGREDHHDHPRRLHHQARPVRGRPGTNFTHLSFISNV